MKAFEKIPQSDDEIESSTQNSEKKEQMEINDTATFQEAIESNNLQEAATWLERVKSDPKYDARWLDHRSRELMKAFCEAGQLNEAEKYINYAQSEDGRNGRAEKIARLRKQTKK